MNRHLLTVSIAGLLWSPAIAQAPAFQDEILGVRLGDRLDEVRKRLDPLGEHGGGKTKDGGWKEAWILKDGDFTSIALKANAKGEVSWISGFLRPGKEVPFAQLGDLSKGTHTEFEAIWNVEKPGGHYRRVAKGSKERARVIYLVLLPPQRGK